MEKGHSHLLSQMRRGTPREMVIRFLGVFASASLRLAMIRPMRAREVAGDFAMFAGRHQSLSCLYAFEAKPFQDLSPDERPTLSFSIWTLSNRSDFADECLDRI